ncbi:MAG: hypothetical protein CVU42_01050 [Chloroflexi bacterium HGW-Chloroflexi-4]|jgi:polysaccharide pyruvyl transferase WcaK-like protein|nr:MAG: hypothetical protein CVU42_01050 [Chloroflexi bacterium HGW-Chloroflexi-4]
MNSNLKIAIIGGSIWGNRGAAAMLETTIAKVKQLNPNTTFVIFTPHPIKDQLLTNNSDLEFYDSRPFAIVKDYLQVLIHQMFRQKTSLIGSVKNLSECDVLLDIGGITFSDGRLIFLPYNVLTILPALMLKIPVIKLSQAAGPFKNPIIHFYAKKLLNRCTKVFARGEKTFQYLKELGISENRVALATDIAFLYKPEFCLTSENTASINQVIDRINEARSKGTVLVALSPSILVQEKSGMNQIDYDQILINLISSTGSKDIHFLVFPNASREKSKKIRNNDIIAIEKLRVKAELSLPRPLLKRITWITYDVDTRGINDLVKNVDVLVASRFHAMVFGLRLSIPTLVVGWGHKYLEAMQAFQQQKYVFDYRDHNLDLHQILFEMIERNSIIRSEMREAIIVVEKSSEAQFQYLNELINDL